MSEKTVASGTVRVLMDATEQVLGTNGLNALLNFADKSHLITNKPDHGFEKTFTDIEYGQIIVSFYELLGVPGAKAIFRLMGKAIARRVIELGLFDSFKDLPPKEKLFKAIELYTITSGRGAARIEGEKVLYDNDGCTTCYNIRSDVPICTIINGFLDEVARWAGLKTAPSVETGCKAMGDTACRYEVVTGA
jgi:predicted hydrocarbon binding protein